MVCALYVVICSFINIIIINWPNQKIIDILHSTINFQWGIVFFSVNSDFFSDNFSRSSIIHNYYLSFILMIRILNFYFFYSVFLTCIFVKKWFDIDDIKLE